MLQETGAQLLKHLERLRLPPLALLYRVRDSSQIATIAPTAADTVLKCHTVTCERLQQGERILQFGLWL